MIEVNKKKIMRLRNQKVYGINVFPSFYSELNFGD